MRHVDILGNIIELRDDVVYTPTGNTLPTLGKVLSFCPKYITIVTYDGTHSVSSERLVVVTDQLLVNKLEVKENDS